MIFSFLSDLITEATEVTVTMEAITAMEDIMEAMVGNNRPKNPLLVSLADCNFNPFH
jgi:hypothetical protein